MTAMVTVTAEMIDAGMSAARGWTRDQLAALGVAWPARAGWKAKLIDSAIPAEAYQKFLSLRNCLPPKPRKLGKPPIHDAPAEDSPASVARGYIHVDRVVNAGLPPDQWRPEPTAAEWEEIGHAARATLTSPSRSRRKRPSRRPGP